ncbi:MAG: DUF4492 domain-containing protein [Alistipes sp.]|jgi:hypothetical protein|nr:DUF4492 domain-containing protein [Alistipes sp.]MBO5972734.1 DUF4492 domain-containing protein [Alistipes sp.]MBO7243137.1 DUF4492 domain-containing protein [Alistipes sp.]
MKNAIISIWKFYVEGFRNMTWGRQLWWLILLKVVILFVLLRGFFFKPVLSGKSDDERSEYVGAQLIDTQSELRTKI